MFVAPTDCCTEKATLYTKDLNDKKTMNFYFTR